MQMLLPERGRIWLTTTLRKRLKSNLYSIVFLLRVGSRDLQKPMISWQPVFSNSSQRYQVKVTCTPCVHFKPGWDGSRAKQPPSMNSFGHLGIEDTKTVCQLHGTVVLKTPAWCNGCTTTKNERSNQEDDHRLGVGDASLKR